MKNRSEDNLTPGQDSFLDVVANLVGILIILVMIVGVQARAAYVKHGEPQASQQLVRQRETAAALQAAGDQMEQEINALAARLQRYQLEMAYREKERDKFLLLLTAARQQLDSAKQQLDQSQRRQLEQATRVAELEKELLSLQQARDALANTETKPSIIEHLPTPMAKTVFGKELHVRLLKGYVTVLPWDEIIARLKEAAEQQVWKLREVPSLTDETGPVGGFRIRYTLVVVEDAIETKVGPVVQRRAQLDHFELVPTSEQLGEPLEKALQPDSQFSAHLALADPRLTTVTVWVYPDSFDEFRRLRHHVYQKGYLTAARPLPFDVLIGGSPYGSRSAAQ
ncbi:MAG: hypothetical protein KatS3mg110_3259 [Pirellulaceae bacterium]|nr:MAG: hypothetical protein KatS3mg110_3259 [Pirellulaceae bacterium]